MFAKLQKINPSLFRRRKVFSLIKTVTRGFPFLTEPFMSWGMTFGLLLPSSSSSKSLLWGVWLLVWVNNCLWDKTCTLAYAYLYSFDLKGSEVLMETSLCDGPRRTACPALHGDFSMQPETYLRKVNIRQRPRITGPAHDHPHLCSQWELSPGRGKTSICVIS